MTFSLDWKGNRLDSLWWSSSGAGRFKSKFKPSFCFLLSGISTIPSPPYAIAPPEGELRKFLCLLMCPPKACPDENSAPHMEHSWTLDLAVIVLLLLLYKTVDNCKVRVVLVGTQKSSWLLLLLWTSPCFSSAPGLENLLWLARWPPRAWNEGKHRLQVLHS